MTANETNPQGPDDGLVWHYTDSNGLLGIVRDKTLRATHLRYLNDPQEGLLFKSVLLEAIERLQDDPRVTSGRQSAILESSLTLFHDAPPVPETNIPEENWFVACASSQCDSLDMWKNYGHETLAFAVGFDCEAPLGVFARTTTQVTALKERIVQLLVPEWSPVRYMRNSEPEDEFKKAFDEAVHGMTELLLDASDAEDEESYSMTASALGIYAGLRLLGKHEAYRTEHEMRVCVQNDDFMTWQFRNGRYGITPFIELTGADEWGKIVNVTNPLPIKKIILSSSAIFNDVMAVRALLESNGFGYDETKPWTETMHFPPGVVDSRALRHSGTLPDIPVEISQIPYRP